MSRIEFFESGYGLMAMRIGIISVDLLVKYDVYKTYLEVIGAGYPVGEAKAETAARCKCHYSSVRRAIHWFEIDDPSFESMLLSIPRGTMSGRNLSNS